MVFWPKLGCIDDNTNWLFVIGLKSPRETERRTREMGLVFYNH